MFQKKITSSKNKNKLSCPSPKKSKEKKLEKIKNKRGNVNAQEKKKKKSDNWQRDCPKKGQCYWQRCCSKKIGGGGEGGNVASQGREKKEKKYNLNLGYLCKVHLSALFSPHFPSKLGG